VPTLVEKLIAPVVEHAIERCWDASSVTQSRRLAGVAKEMLV
jgi:GC-rich sequence DNA-binding factor